MPRRKDTVDAHVGSILALGFRPFSTDDLELFETIVSPRFSCRPFMNRRLPRCKWQAEQKVFHRKDKDKPQLIGSPAPLRSTISP